jgi:alkylated DNA repair dioxygenase AlkB
VTAQRLDLPDAEVIFYPALFDAAESERLFHELNTTTQWEQKHLRLPSGMVALPRLVAWYGDAGKVYTYSNLTFNPHLWTPAMLEIKERVEKVSSAVFNSVLLNLYRNEQDSVGWHSDDEPELGIHPVIASVSFGVTRDFQLKHRTESKLKHTVQLTSGSLLLMRGTTQEFWKHQLPKAKQPTAPRINLTFRIIKD